MEPLAVAVVGYRRIGILVVVAAILAGVEGVAGLCAGGVYHGGGILMPGGGDRLVAGMAAVFAIGRLLAGGGAGGGEGYLPLAEAVAAFAGCAGLPAQRAAVVLHFFGGPGGVILRIEDGRGGAVEGDFVEEGGVACEGNGLQIGAVGKGALSDRADVFGKGDLGQGGVSEGVITDVGDSFRKGDGGQAGAESEHSIADTPEIGGQLDLLQGFAAIEHVIADGCDAFRNLHGSQGGAA